MSVPNVLAVTKNCPAVFQPPDRPRRRMSTRSNSSPTPSDLSPLNLSVNSGGKSKAKSGQKEEFRKMFPYYQIKISKRTRSQKEGRPPVPRVGNAAFSQDLKNLKYQQIEHDFAIRKGPEKGKMYPSDSAKENVSQGGDLFFQSDHDIKEEEKQLHEELISQLSELSSLETILEDNFRLVHECDPPGLRENDPKMMDNLPNNGQAEDLTVRSHRNVIDFAGSESVKTCKCCKFRFIRQETGSKEYVCGVCAANKRHPVVEKERVLVLEVQLLKTESKQVIPKPPSKPSGPGTRTPSSTKEGCSGSFTDRTGLGGHIRRRIIANPVKETIPELRIGNDLLQLTPNEPQYIYLLLPPFPSKPLLPSSQNPAEISIPFIPDAPVKDSPNPITPSFNSQKHFQFSVGKEDKHQKRAFTEENEGLSDISEAEVDHLVTDLSLIEDKSELEISFSDPTNTSLTELFDVPPTLPFPVLSPIAHSALMVSKDLDDVLQRQLREFLQGTERVKSDCGSQVEVYGRHVRAVIRGLKQTARPQAAAVEKVFKGLVHVLDRVLCAHTHLTKLLSESERKQASSKDSSRDYQLQICVLKQNQAQTELKLQQKIASLVAQTRNYEEQMELYKKELEEKEARGSMRTTLTHLTTLPVRFEPDIIDPYS